MKKKTNEEKEKKSELTGLTHQTRLIRQTCDSCHESLITKQKKLNINKLNFKKKLKRKKKEKGKKILNKKNINLKKKTKKEKPT